MITEPELTSGPEWEAGRDRDADLDSGAGADQGPGSGPAPELGDQLATPGGPVGRRHWLWAAGGVAAASVLWVAALQGIGYGHTAAPDLHGYRITDNPCTGQNLQPLTDALAAEGFVGMPASLSRGPALDHVSCDMVGYRAPSGNWQTTYTVTFTLDLHKKTDPRAEFEDSTRARVSTLAPMQYAGGLATTVDDGATPRPYSGLGDSAYTTYGTSRQSLSVLHGGAVFTLTLQASTDWQGSGKIPTGPDGTVRLPGASDTSALRPQLPKTMRHLMTLMSTPAGSR